MRARWRAALYRHFVVVGILSAGLVVAAVGLDLATPASADPGTVVAQNQGPFTYLFDGPTISKPAGTLQAGVTDSDPNQSGSCCTASLDTPPPSGSVTVRPDGSFTYVPGVGFLGSESFTFIRPTPMETHPYRQPSPLPMAHFPVRLRRLSTSHRHPTIHT
jgi:hypothetical protein